jgi:hypothetical protein
MMNLRSLSLIAAVLGAAGGVSARFPIIGRSEPSEAHKRRIAKWNEDAPRRLAEAREIHAWNKLVLRRNYAFARTGMNKHQRNSSGSQA